MKSTTQKLKNVFAHRVHVYPEAALPSFSVIIPTKYRPEVVEVTVRTVLRQTAPPHQIVIVDQSSTGETRRRIEKQFAQADPSVTADTQLIYLYDTSIPGAAAARNRGMELAGGDVWLFLDDDVQLEQDFIEQLIDVYRREPAATGVSGVFTNYRPPHWLHRIWDGGFRFGPFHDERQPIYWNADRLRVCAPFRVTKFTGALMSFRAEAIRDLRFDENVHKTGAEDADFCARLPEGSLLLITPGARVLHQRAPEGRSKNHWVQTDVERCYYLYRRNWRRGVRNRLCFAWLLVGYFIVIMLSCVRRMSLGPWRGLCSGLREGALEARQSGY